MEFSDDWKSYFAIGNSLAPPLLLSSQKSSTSLLGPVFFNPKPQTSTQIFSSPSLCPPLLSSQPQLSLSVSTTKAIGPFLTHSRLQFLQCPDKNRNIVLVFFSTGCNHDQLGFLVLSVKESNLVARGDDNGDVFTINNRLHGQIMRILVNPVPDYSDLSGDSLVTIGYLLACTASSVYWFSVEMSETSEMPVVNYLCFKSFESCSVVSACGSPYLHQESIVLLDTGALFLFDLETYDPNLPFDGTRMTVSSDENGDCSEICKWLGCGFSWHPRVFIVARSDAVFMVDFRRDECDVTCLAAIDKLKLHCSVEKEQFLAFSRASSDKFQFVLASDTLLLLFDVRKPMMPVLQWAHGLDKTMLYIDVFSLAELRSHSRDDSYKLATESGFCIILGSFWNCEFSLFCYGPPLPATRISNICKSLYAWDLPSGLLLSNRQCPCGSCLVREEFYKDALPEWIFWQQKKEIVLGFGILSNVLSSQLSEQDEYGGFTLIRLMSSGKLESQRYFASWELIKKWEVAHRANQEVAHRDSLLLSEANLLYSGVTEYNFKKKYNYLKLDNLYAFMNLAHLGPQEKKSLRVNSHKVLPKKLEVCGFNSPAISSVFNDINLPTSIREVALRSTWAGLPEDVLQLAFSSYSEFPEASLEFLDVPDLPQFPPYFLRKPSCGSSKWSSKVQRSDTLVGPVVPLPVLHTLDDVHNVCPNSEEVVGRLSSEVELGIHCNEIMQAAREMAISITGSLHDDNAASLANDKEEILVDSQKPKSFLLYQLAAFDCSTMGQTPGNCDNKDDRFATLITKLHEKEADSNEKVDTVRLEEFYDLCPIELKFDPVGVHFGSQEMKAYNELKKQFSKWQEGFPPYQKFCSQFKFQNQDA